MTFLDTGVIPQSTPPIAGQTYERHNRIFECLANSRSCRCLDIGKPAATSQRSPQESSLKMIQDSISDVSMHLPHGFAAGLNRQFANLMDEDAWEEEDKLISSGALTVFLTAILYTGTNRRPGIGTNGWGSVTASWRADKNRLIVECLPSGYTSLLLSNVADDGTIERAAFQAIRPDRILSVLKPFSPEVWFDN